MTQNEAELQALADYHRDGKNGAISKHELSIKGGSTSNLGKHLRLKNMSAVECHMKAKRTITVIKGAIAN